MDDDKRKLAECWRDLAGWRPGMMATGGAVVCDVDADELCVAERDGYRMTCWGGCPGASYLPDPDASANWGVWLDSLQEQWAVTVEQTTRLGVHHFAVSVGPGMHESACRASALLGAVCDAHAKLGGPLVDENMREADGSLPPSVQAWWAEQQEGATDADG